MLCLYTQLYLSQVCTEFRPQVIHRMSKMKQDLDMVRGTQLFCGSLYIDGY